MLIRKAPVGLGKGGTLEGTQISRTIRRIEDLRNFFHDATSVRNIDPQTLVYEVDVYSPSESSTNGALNFGVTRIEPGRVGTEFFMTKGHVHSRGERTEFYWGIDGTGCLLTGDPEGRWRLEQILPGSVHYISPFSFHRLINTGEEQLTVGAVWPNDAGHDYDSFDRERMPRVISEAGTVRVLLSDESDER